MTSHLTLRPSSPGVRGSIVFRGAPRSGECSKGLLLRVTQVCRACFLLLYSTALSLRQLSSFMKIWRTDPLTSTEPDSPKPGKTGKESSLAQGQARAATSYSDATDTAKIQTTGSSIGPDSKKRQTRKHLNASSKTNSF